MSRFQAIERAARDAKHKDELDHLNRRIGEYVTLLDRAEKQRDAALAIKRNPGDVKPLKVSVADKSEAMAVALASDWHVEETVDPVSVNGVNAYNLEIAEDRISKFFRGVVRLTEIERAGAKIDHLLLWLGGDLMTGYIHEELAESNSMSPVQTVLWLQNNIIAGLELLKPNFSRILVVTSYGNHGRTTRKPRHATGAANSYEWMLYKTLEKHVKGVEWAVGESYHNLVDVYGRRIRFHHGDGLQYQGGIGGLTIPVEKAIASWNKSPIRADLDCFGHYHQKQENPKWCSNGSLIGYNAYSISIKAAYEPPQQTYFLFDKKRGRTMTAPIIVG